MLDEENSTPRPYNFKAEHVLPRPCSCARDNDRTTFLWPKPRPEHII
jgi:hypothetical protein